MLGCTSCQITFERLADNLKYNCTRCGSELVQVEVVSIANQIRVIQTQKRVTEKDIMHARKIDEMKKQFGPGRCLTCARVVGQDQDFCTKNCETTFDEEFERQIQQVQIIMSTIQDIEAQEPDERFID